MTKNELRAQQQHKKQLERYLPTLQLKKAMLQSVVLEARLEIVELEEKYSIFRHKAEAFAPLLVEKVAIDPEDAVIITNLEKDHENIAGTEVPIFKGITFKELTYNLFETPPWIDGVVVGLRSLATLRAQVAVVEEKKRLLEEELRQVSIRVNLFEKVLIPRADENIKKIRVFLGDEELGAVGRAKVAKQLIEKKKEASLKDSKEAYAR